MIIVFDMDNTLVDEFGSTLRPGILDLLAKLTGEGHRLVLWTNSTGPRAREIILHHGLRRHFTTFIFREDYDPQDKGLVKNITRVDGDVLVDDDPGEIKQATGTGKRGVLVAPYRKNGKTPPGEMEKLYRQITGR